MIMKEWFEKIDSKIVSWLRQFEMPLVRIAIFIVYFWFGSLKLIGSSPAAPLVLALFDKTIHFVSFPVFYTFLSIYEVVIGILFLLPDAERVAIFLLGLHLFTTALPLILLPDITWQSFLVPTLEGQYIIKNILIAALAVVVGSRVVPIAPNIDSDH